MNTTLKTAIALIGLATLSPLSAVQAQSADPNFANTVIGSSGLGTNGLYNTPSAVLGQPTTLINGNFDIPSGTYHASMSYAAYNQDPQGNNLIVTLGNSGTVTVEFTIPITHSDAHWYGDDFIVFGNTFFPGSKSVTPTTDMTQNIINGSGSIYQNGVPSVSVSADGITFITLTPQSAYYPTNPYKWIGVSTANPSGWDDTPGSLNDFTKPVNPALTPASFAGDNVADAANRLYDGSAGGAAFTLAGTGLTSISYIRFTSGGNSSVIDAVSRVSFAPAPEPGEAAALLIGVLGLAALAVRRRRTGTTQL